MTNVDGFSSKRAAQTLFALLLSGALCFPSAVKADESKDLPFTDIEKHWAKEAILQSYENGLVAGVGKTKQFQPERYMTRGEFLVLIDRFYLKTEQDLFPLSLMTEDDETGWGFKEPYLPYTDVDRLTWIYPSILRVSLVYDRLFGEKAFEGIYPAGKLQPDEPVSREEAAKILQMFVVHSGGRTVDDVMKKWGWFTGELTGNLKRGEAAVVANRLASYLQEHPILPLLDYDDSKFPVVPEITDIFPMFADYGNDLTEAENTYIRCVNLIADHEDEEDTFQQLKKLADGNFPNQVGVYYYLSWDQFEPLTENLDYAIKALDKFLALDKEQQSTETLQLLTANIYDISLQIAGEDPTIFAQTLAKLLPYEKQLNDRDQKETFSLYLAAFEARSGKVDEAISRYQSLPSQETAALNAIYYLLQAGSVKEAEQLVQSLSNGQGDNGEPNRFALMLQDELSMLAQQNQYANRLAEALRKQDEMSGYQAVGESNLSGYVFHYVDQIDNRSQISHSMGFYKSPEKLVLDKMELYTDERNKQYYSFDFDQKKWNAPRNVKIDYVHEWVQEQDVETRLQLGARYVLQSAGRYDVITEWIPGQKLKARLAKEHLNIQSVKDIPAFVTKYYIDRETGMLEAKTWRYEETYDKEFIAYSGTESYAPYDAPIHIPKVASGGR